MTKDEALQMCLEYIETDAHERKYVRHAIKAALEAKDEPVAWVYPEFWQHLENLNCGTAYRLSGIGRQPLYSAPQKQPPVIDKSVARRIATQLGWEPPRTPITDDDIRQANHHMVCGAYDYSFKQGVRWAEKVHGIKWEWEK